MNAGLLSEAVDLVDEAALLPPPARDAFYAKRCRDQAELLALVRRIEAAPSDSRAPILGDFFEDLAPQLFAEDDAADPLIGMEVGDHRIEARIGEGGMGRVYRATYLSHRVEVALKVLDGPRGQGAGAHQRLQREVGLLERCKHPAIVRARSSGRLPDGRTYFTMDLVDGRPITAYCAAETPILAERLRLLIGVCEAVQAAHAVGVIHRDLKPANILVADSAGPGVSPSIRLLDFGIAEAAGDADVSIRSYISVAYAAPEHAETPSPQTDIYSLGILLAELSLGRLPFDLSKRTPCALHRSIREQGIRPLRALADPETQPWLARMPGLRWRELDAIYRKATASEPGERYGTVRELAVDLQRFLAHRPVHAFKLSSTRRALYESRRLVGRNRLAAAASGLIFFLLIGAVASYVWGLRQSRNAALQTAARATAHAKKMQELAAGLYLDGAGALSASSTVEDLLDRGSTSAKTLDSEPEEQAEFLTILGQAYQGLGRFAKAERVFQQVLSIRIRLNGADSAQAADVLGRQADVLDRESRWKEALGLGQRAFAIKQRTLPPGSKDLLETEELLAGFWAEAGDNKKSASLLEDVIRLETGKPDMLYDLARAQSDLASVENHLGHPERSVSLTQQATAINRRILGSRNLDEGINLINLSGFHTQLAQYTQGEAEAREGLSILEEKLPPGDDNIAYAKNNLGVALLHQARWTEAQSLLEAALHEMRAEPTPSPLEDATVLWGLGAVYEGQGKLPRALSTFQSSLAEYKRLYPRPSFYWTSPLLGLASVSLKQGKLTAAEGFARQDHEICGAQLPAGHRKTVQAEILLGRVLTAQHRYGEAQLLLEEALRLSQAAGEPQAEYRGDAEAALQQLAAAARPLARPRLGRSWKPASRPEPSVSSMSSADTLQFGASVTSPPAGSLPQTTDMQNSSFACFKQSGYYRRGSETMLIRNQAGAVLDDGIKMTTHDKALRINLDPVRYGTFAEIGAGQEVARWFFRVGGAASTISKSISAYDMAVSDAIYGRSKRYVSRDRLQAMLDHEHSLNIERLRPTRGNTTAFFAFADTVSARNFKGTNECHGWMGVKYQTHPKDADSQIVIHVRMLDTENSLQQEALGIVGVNLLYAACFLHQSPEKMLESLLDNLTTDRIEIDMAEFSGIEFRHVDNRVMSLKLVQLGLSGAAMFGPSGEVLQPSEALRKRPILVERGSFRPPTLVNIDMLNSAHTRFAAELNVAPDQIVELMEITMNNLMTDGEIDLNDFLARADLLAAAGKTVLISDYFAYYRLAKWMARYTTEPIALTMGVASLEVLFEEKQYAALEGGILEGCGKLFTKDLRIYVYPYLDPVTKALRRVDSAEIAPDVRNLYRHIVEGGKIKQLDEYNVDALHIFSRDILKRIKNEDPSWIPMVPPEIAALIRQQRFFGYREPEHADHADQLDAAPLVEVGSRRS